MSNVTNEKKKKKKKKFCNRLTFEEKKIIELILSNKLHSEGCLDVGGGEKNVKTNLC